MSTDDVIERICRLPLDFYSGTKSMASLISESGVQTCPMAIAVTNIASYLREHPALVTQWLSWSANKRVTSGWYFLRRNDKFVVGFFPEGEKFIFDDLVIACAEFVNREVMTLMNINKSLPSH